MEKNIDGVLEKAIAFSKKIGKEKIIYRTTKPLSICMNNTLLPKPPFDGFDENATNYDIVFDFYGFSSTRKYSARIVTSYY